MKKETTSLYVSKKIVEAVKKDDGVTIIYKDGYVSSCPKDTFDRDYIHVGDFEKVGDVALTGDNFLVRVIAEAAQLANDIKNLTKFIDSDTFKTLDVRNRELMVCQVNTQMALHKILTQRIEHLLVKSDVKTVI